MVSRKLRMTFYLVKLLFLGGCVTHTQQHPHSVAQAPSELSVQTESQTTQRIAVNQQGMTSSDPIITVAPVSTPEARSATIEKTPAPSKPTAPKAISERPVPAQSEKQAIVIDPCEALWQNARSAQNINSYQTYLSRCSGGAHQNEAQKSIEYLKYTHAESSNSEATLLSFIDEYPQNANRQKLLLKAEELYWKQHEQSEDTEVYQNYLNRYGKTPGRYTQTAQRRLDEKIQFDAAIRADTFEGYRSFCRDFPNSRYVSEVQKRTEVSYWLQAVNQNRSAHALHQLGIAYSYLMQLEKARGCFEQELELNPTASAYLELGRMVFELNQPSKAMDYFKKTLELDSKSHEALYFLGRCAETNNTRQAIDYFTKAIQLSPQYAPAYFYRALCYHLYNNSEAAKRDFQEVLKLNSDLAEMARNMLANL